MSSPLRSRDRSRNFRWMDALAEISPAWWGFAGVVLLLTPVVSYLVLNRRPAPVASSFENREEVKVAQHLDDRTEVHSLLAKFLQASTPEEKVPFVRGGASLLPAMKSWYAHHPDEPGGNYHPGPSTVSEWIGGREFTLFGGRDRFEDVRETIAERLPEGLRLDWRCLTGAGDLEWEDWLRDRPQRPVTMRGTARTDELYEGSFADKSKYLCVKITDVTSNFTVWAYAERLSAHGKYLSDRLPSPEESAKVTGTFAFPENPSPVAAHTPQVLATRIGTMGWLDESLSQSPAVRETPPQPIR
jgi:hypothetical protein